MRSNQPPGYHEEPTPTARSCSALSRRSTWTRFGITNHRASRTRAGPRGRRHLQERSSGSVSYLSVRSFSMDTWTHRQHSRRPPPLRCRPVCAVTSSGSARSLRISDWRIGRWRRTRIGWGGSTRSVTSVDRCRHWRRCWWLRLMRPGPRCVRATHGLRTGWPGRVKRLRGRRRVPCGRLAGWSGDRRYVMRPRQGGSLWVRRRRSVRRWTRCRPASNEGNAPRPSSSSSPRRSTSPRRSCGR